MKFTEDIILKYLDGDLSDHEAGLFEKEVKKDLALAQLYTHHKAIHNLLLNEESSSPSPEFLNKVMKSIATVNFYESKFFNKTRLFVLLLIAFAVATTFYYFTINFYPSMDGALSNKITLRDFTVDLQPAQQLLSSTILFKVVFYVNGLVSLLLFDRAILKPYFSRRRERYSI